MNIFCPKCRKLIPHGASTCVSCGASFKMEDGYFDYDPENDFYWGELSLEEMKALNERAEKKGFRKACFEYFKDHPRRDLFEYFLNEDGRSAFINFIYRKDRGERCLDLGSGLGAIPSALSKLFGEVYSLELVRERVRFQTIRKRQDGIKNWTILKGNTNSLPFPDNYFDFVSANGMLEWAAIANFDESPRDVQIRFLKEIARVLKPDGVCYVGIENRTGIQYFRGALDHSGIKYTSLMPRFLANLVCFLKRKKGNFHFDTTAQAVGGKYYRVYTYTKNGYKKLLADAGISKNRIFHTNFTYNLAYAAIDDTAIPLVPRGRDVLKSKMTQFKHAKNRLSAWFFSMLTPNFLIYFTKDGVLESDFEQRIEKEKNDHGPLYFYRGFNNMLAYSLSSEKFYKTPSMTSDVLISEEKASGTSPEQMDTTLFQKTLSVLKEKYHRKTESSPNRLVRFTEWVHDIAEKHEMLTPELTSNLKKINERYAHKDIFSRNHGDVWLGNTFVSNGSVSLIDEEKDEFGLIPIELMRFLLSVTGYSMQDREKSEYKKYLGLILQEYRGVVDEEMLEDFYIPALWYEASRRGLFGSSPRKELFYFLETVRAATSRT